MSLVVVVVVYAGCRGHRLRRSSLSASCTSLVVVVVVYVARRRRRRLFVEWRLRMALRSSFRDC